MKLSPLTLLVLGTGIASAQPGLTIYNGHFAVVRDTVPLELKAGENIVRYSGATSSLDPSSVILRDPTGKIPLSILEQNYRNDPVTEQSLLDRFEGQPQAITFLIKEPQKPDRTIEGHVIRSGHVPGGAPMQPIIEVDGKLVFELPGRPLFAGLKDDNILKPELTWKIQSPAAAQLQAELAYLTGGLEWEASYNLVLPEKGDTAEMNGWVTLKNRSGKVFENAAIKLMAGDVHHPQRSVSQYATAKSGGLGAAMAPVEEKAFDDFHLYTLPRPTTLRDQETKQLEFTRAIGVPTKRVYIYEASSVPFSGQPMLEKEWGSFGANTKVRSVLEFKNDEPSKLGIPLPAGNIRVYRKDGDQLEFVGEDNIDHTPRNEPIRLALGNAFDLVGERKQTNFKIDNARNTLEESFEIRIRNQSKNTAQIQVIEHMNRAANWVVSEKSSPFTKHDSQTIHFTATVAPDGETVLKYSVRYTW
ncbi:MAG: hypothetical protein WCO60_03515 [Verrucomicrobiota bacterium]